MAKFDQVLDQPLAPRRNAADGRLGGPASESAADGPLLIDKRPLIPDARPRRDGEPVRGDGTTGEMVVLPRAIEPSPETDGVPKALPLLAGSSRAQSMAIPGQATIGPLETTLPVRPPEGPGPEPVREQRLTSLPPLSRRERPLQSGKAATVAAAAVPSAPISQVGVAPPAIHPVVGGSAATTPRLAEQAEPLEASTRPAADFFGTAPPGASRERQLGTATIGAIDRTPPPDAFARDAAQSGSSGRPAAPPGAAGGRRTDRGRRVAGPSPAPPLPPPVVAPAGPSHRAPDDTDKPARPASVETAATARLAPRGEERPDRVDNARAARLAAAVDAVPPSMRDRLSAGDDHPAPASLAAPAAPDTPTAMPATTAAVAETRDGRLPAPPPQPTVSIDIGRVEIQVKAPKAGAPVRRTPPRRHGIDPGFDFGSGRRW